MTALHLHVWFVYVPSVNIFSSFAILNMSEYSLYWKFFSYVCTSFVVSVFILTKICICHVIGLVGSVSNPVVFCTRYTSIRVSSVFTSCVAGATVTPSRGTVFCIQLSSNLTVSGVSDMTLNGPKRFDNSFVKGAFVMPANSVICLRGLSTKMCCLGLNCCVCWKVL